MKVGNMQDRIAVEGGGQVREFEFDLPYLQVELLKERHVSTQPCCQSSGD